MRKEIKTLLRVAFEAFDANCSGSMDLKEFKRVIKIMGVKMSGERVK